MPVELLFFDLELLAHVGSDDMLFEVLLLHVLFELVGVFVEVPQQVQLLLLFVFIRL